MPTVAGKTVRYKKADGKPGYEPRVRPEFQQESKSDADFPSRAAVRSAVRPPNRLSARPDRPVGKPDFRSDARLSRPPFKSDARTESRPAFRKDAGPDLSARSDRPAPRGDFKAPFKPGFKPGFKSEGRPDFKRPAPGGRPAFGAKPKRFEPPVEEYVLPPRKSPAPGFEDDFDAPAAGKKSGFNPDYKPGFRTGDKPAFRKDARPAGRAPFQKDGPKRFGGDRPSTSDDYPDGEPEKRVKIGIEPVPDGPGTKGLAAGSIAPVQVHVHSNLQDPRPAGRPFAGRPSSDRPFRPAGDRPSADRPFRPRTDGPSGGRPAGRPFSPRPAEGASEFRPRQAGPRPSDSRPGGARSGPPSRPGQFRDKPVGAGFSARPPRAGGSDSRSSGPRSRPFEGSGDRPREFKPRDSKPREFKPGAPKKFGAKPGSGAGKTGPDGAPRIKERWRNSFTGKNKGRPKPKE